MFSDRHDAIFVHVPKTGGQSIELAFLRSYGLSWENRAPLLLRASTASDGPRVLAHLFAWEYVALGHVAADRFDACEKFAVVRDPYARAVSGFTYAGATGRLRDFLVEGPKDRPLDHRLTLPQTDFLLDQSQELILVDTLLRFETLAEDWRQLSVRLLGRHAHLPHRNRSGGTLRTGDLDRADIDCINELYSRDFEMLGYDMR